jgi:hypothetical protein
LAGRARCDGDGNVYLRSSDSETSQRYHPTSALPIRKIRPDGSLGSSFGVADVSPGLLAIDFFVAVDGGVYQAARSESERSVYLVSYLPDGTLKSRVRLDATFFIPYQLAVFRSGEFLVSGIHGPYNRTPYTAVFSADGRLIREIYEPEDEDARKRAEAGFPGFRPESMESSNDFVTHGDAALGSDGNAYLLRSGSPALIYVISSRGDIVRKLRVGSVDSELVAGGVKSDSGELAISFLRERSNAGLLEIVDYRGDLTATYVSDDSSTYPGLLACYGPNRLVFVNLESGARWRLTMAEPK